MNRYLISSPRFTGHIEILYREDTLMCIDFRQAEVDDEQRLGIKERIPMCASNLADAFKGTKVSITEADFEISLDDFKREYPYSRNYHLLDNRWKKMSKADQVEAYYSAIEYRKYCNRNSDWYKAKIADSWLANKEYKNDWRKM